MFVCVAVLFVCSCVAVSVLVCSARCVCFVCGLCFYVCCWFVVSVMLLCLLCLLLLCSFVLCDACAVGFAVVVFVLCL